jgi:hypothetical protein
MKPRLLLYCDAVQSTFALAREGEDAREYFTELRAALDHAASMVGEETPIMIYNEAGRVIVESIVTPRRQR